MPMAQFRRAGLDVGLVTDTAGFAALESEWDDLHRHAAGAWPHDSWALLFSWWESCGGRAGLKLMTLRDPDRHELVIVVPLMVVRRRGLRMLTFLSQTEPLDVLVREGWESSVGPAVAAGLRALPGWDVAELRLRPQARIWDAYRRWDGPCEQRPLTDYAFVPALPREEVLAGLTRKTRKNLFRALRAAEADGLTCTRVPAADAAEAGARLVALHRELWADRRITAAHASDEWASFIRATAGRVVARGLGDVVEWRRGGVVEISQLYLYGPDAVHAYQVGASSHAVERLQWSSLYIDEGLTIARARGARYLDLAYGDESYKSRWNPNLAPHHRVRLGRGPLGYAFLALARLQATRKRRTPRRSTPS
ncbi:MAG: GNAT family N-acetyltransferase [Pseudonocardia sp.]